MGDLPKSQTSSSIADIKLSRQKSGSLRDICKTYKSRLTKWHADRHHGGRDDDDNKFNISGPKLLSRTISCNATATPTRISNLNFPKSPIHHCPGDEEFTISSPKLLARVTSRITPIPSPKASCARKISTKTPPSDADVDNGDLCISSPTLLARTTSRISPVGSSRGFGSPPAASDAHGCNVSEASSSAGNTPTAKMVSPRNAMPIFFSQSGVRRKPPPVEKKLECSLEDLCFGCIKKINITRDVLSSSGLFVQEEEMLTIKVKPGWKRGTKIIFEGKGDERPGTLPADIIFEIEEKEHPLFVRRGEDLELGVEVPLVQALTGCSMWVPVLGGGQAEVSIEEEVMYPGYEAVVAGQGMPRCKGQGKRGDLRLNFMVEFPDDLTTDQRAQVAHILEQCCFD